MYKGTMAVTAMWLLLSMNATAQKKDSVDVYRWHWPAGHAYYSAVEGEYTDAQMKEKGWTDKTLICREFKTPGPGRIPVYGWYNATSGDHISTVGGDFTDEQMAQWGYSQKHLQCYARKEDKPLFTDRHHKVKPMQ